VGACSYAVVIGTGICNSDSGVSIGGSTVDGLEGVAIGTVTIARAPYSVAVGPRVTVEGERSSLIGCYSTSKGSSTVVAGSSNTSNSNFDILVGSTLTTPVNGSGLATGTVDSVSDAGGGSVTIHSSDIPAGLATGQLATIAGTTIYDGTFTVANVTAGTFDIVHAWSVTASGTYTVRAADGYNVYVGVNIAGAVGTGNADVNQVAVGTGLAVLGSSIVAIGKSCVISGIGSVVVGDGSTVYGQDNVVVGRGSSTGSIDGNFEKNVICGYSSTIWGASSVAVGRQITVGVDVAYVTNNAVALGNSVSVGAGAHYAIGVGYLASCGGVGSIAVGSVASAMFQTAIAVGSSSTAGGIAAIAAGAGSIAGAFKAVSVGYNAWGYGESDVVVGPTNTANNRFDVLYGSTLTTPINGSGAASGTVDSVSDAGGGSVTIHSSDIPAGLVAGQLVTIAGAGVYNGTFTAANVTAGTFDVVHAWSATSTGTYTVRAEDGYNVYVGVNIVDNVNKGNADTYQVALGTNITVQGSRVVVIGASAASSAGITSSVVLGPSANVSHSYAMVFGAGATSTGANQVVFGLSGGGTPGLCAVHQLVVRGYNGGNLNTLDVVDNPAGSGDPNLGVSGLTIVYTQNGTVSNKTLKAALLVNVPGTALVAYFDA
jgi:hypothetical protein